MTMQERFRGRKITAAHIGIWADVVKLALREIAETDGRYSADQVYEYMVREQLPDEDWFGLWLCDDRAALADGTDPLDAVCGMATMVLGPGDIGERVAFISNGWIRRGYHGEPWKLFMPYVINWSKERGCKRVRSATKRHVNAYARWIGQHGFKQAETLFEMELTT